MKGGVKLREAKATTLRKVLLARSCDMGGEDVVGEVKGVDSRSGGVGGSTIGETSIFSGGETFFDCGRLLLSIYCLLEFVRCV